MPIKIDNPDKEGEEMEVYTADEVAAQRTELESAKAERDAAKAEAEKFQKVSAEKTENFKKLNELTETEKAGLSAEKLEAMKRAEASESRVKELEDRYNTDTQNRIKKDTEDALAKYHGGDEKLKEALEKNFKLINMEGTDTATIQERARLAASMEKGKSDRPNPLMYPMGGSAPKSAEKNKTEEFMKSDKAKEAQKRMGEKVD